ncbi:MAG TPA: dehydrogenase E1 component subunit alpha/beta, partial [Acidimicrobiia bacterium]
LLEIYRHMVTGRSLETRLHNMYRGGRLGGAVYPGVGQEAAMVGFAYALEPKDVFGGTHRDLMAQLTKGVTLEETLLNFYGKKDAPTGGRDGNSHFGVVDKGTLMVVSPLPDAWPVAVGCALAFRQTAQPRVALANCGEGATATGTWHESVNMAAVLKLPIVFCVQNNQYAYSTPNEAGFNTPNTADRAQAYGIPSVVVDGNDVFACYSAAKEAVERARSGEGPTLIEAITFRHYGHAGHDPADYVRADEREYWLARDPISRLEAYLIERGLLTDDSISELATGIDQEIRRLIAWAQEQEDPGPADELPGMFAARTQPTTSDDGGEAEESTYLEAIASALDLEMARDDRVFLMGEDIGAFGGAFKVTQGLYEKYGADRVLDTPISEMVIVGSAVGAALMGRIPIAELQFWDFLYPGMDQLTTEAAKYHWKAGKAVPMVLRGPSGAGVRSGPFHSISPEGLLSHHPGLKVVVPSTPHNAKGLLLASIRDPNPVMFLEHKKLYRDTSIKAAIPTGDYEVPLGQARLAREGTDVTVVAWSAMAHTALRAAERLASEGVSAEVVDLQTIVPLDWDAVFASVEKTSRLVIVQEDVPFASVASHIAAVVADQRFWALDSPIRRVTPPHTHIPFQPGLEDAFLPQVEDVVDTVLELIRL